MRAAAALLSLVVVTSCAGPATAERTPWPTQTYGEITVTFVRPGTTPAVSPTIPVGTAIRILGSSFDPQIMEVPLGSVVTWTSRDPILHTVTSGTFGRPDGQFDRELFGGATFSFTFAQAGRFSYYCRFHGGMQATLVVR
ncbi:MAG: hypothetical protein HYU87_10435 [Chloroflexi bacterium]|nr:hypothetical protein [Chloroflexota bacterium]